VVELVHVGKVGPPLKEPCVPLYCQGRLDLRCKCIKSLDGFLFHCPLGPDEWNESTQLTESFDTASPTRTSTAAWTLTARIGLTVWSARTRHTASSTQPGRRERRRWPLMIRGGVSLTRRAASFLARRSRLQRVAATDSAVSRFSYGSLDRKAILVRFASACLHFRGAERR
jgi:hypothetical protein